MIAIFLAGCGSNTTQTTKPSKVGYFIDSAVSGVEYTCGNYGGITGVDGEFIYNNNCKVVFKIGGIILGEIEGSSINEDNNVIPADIFGLSRDNITNEKIICLIQFLQSLDDDDNPSNNIVISNEMRKNLINSILDFTKDDINSFEIEKIVFSIDKNFVDKDSALRHYKKVLRSKLKVILEDKLVSIADEIQTAQIQDDYLSFLSNDSVSKQTTKTVKINLEKKVPTVTSSMTVSNKQENDLKSGFSYSNQHVVDIEILAKSSLSNKQIILFEELNIIPTPVGEIDKFEKKILSTVFNKDGKLNLKYTFGNHIKSIWMLVPFYGIKMELPIVNNRIYITLNEGV